MHFLDRRVLDRTDTGLDVVGGLTITRLSGCLDGDTWQVTLLQGALTSRAGGHGCSPRFAFVIAFDPTSFRC